MSKKKLACHFVIKRLFDMLFSGIAIIILIPMWAAIGIAIKLDSKGKIIFVQDRLTKDGKVFEMYKFRSMVENAETMGTGLFNYENDPRVTKVGRFLRNTSLDELPQLWNVLKGDMSIVGPRPAVNYELGDYETLNKRFKKRFSVPGGITGLAQVKGRNENSWSEKIKFDNRYIDIFQRYGIWIDIWILMETVKKVFKKENIYEARIEGASSDLESAAMAECEIIKTAHWPD